MSWNPSTKTRSPTAAFSFGINGSTFLLSSTLENKRLNRFPQSFLKRHVNKYPDIHNYVLLEHNSIACDSTPLIFCGFRLQTAITIFPTKDSNGTNPARPETTFRGPDSSPKSIFSTYRESASGCCSLQKHCLAYCIE